MALTSEQHACVMQVSGLQVQHLQMSHLVPAVCLL